MEYISQISELTNKNEKLNSEISRIELKNINLQSDLNNLKNEYVIWKIENRINWMANVAYSRKNIGRHIGIWNWVKKIKKEFLLY